MNGNRLTKAIESLEQVIATFEMYEHSLWPDQCEWAVGVLVELTAAWQHLSAASPEEQEALGHLKAQTDEVWVQLAAFEPHCQSREIRYLRQRKVLVDHLREMVTKTTRLQTWSSQVKERSASLQLDLSPPPASVAHQHSKQQQASIASRKRRQQGRRPSYLKVLGPDDQPDQNGERLISTVNEQGTAMQSTFPRTGLLSQCMRSNGPGERNAKRCGSRSRILCGID